MAWLFGCMETEVWIGQRPLLPGNRFANSYDLILAAAKSADSKKWTPLDVELVNHLIAEIEGKYNVDPLRVVVHGYETGGTLASFVAFRNREIIRAMAVVDAPLTVLPPENDPQYRFEVYIATSGKSPASRSLEKVLAMLREDEYTL